MNDNNTYNICPECQRKTCFDMCHHFKDLNDFSKCSLCGITVREIRLKNFEQILK